jgi:Transglycosylase SLT domain
MHPQRLSLAPVARSVLKALRVVAHDVGQGMLVVSHNTLALLGLGLVSLLTLFGTQDNLRHAVEHHALTWLAARQEARAEMRELATSEPPLAEPEPSAAQRVAAVDLGKLPQQQAAIAQWLSRRYKVAPEAVASLVQEAWTLGDRARIDPTLILAVIAVESSFNPYAQSPVGAQGLMQVMTRVHDNKYERFGGERAALDPLSNLRVGVQVLRECIQRAGSVTEGLRHYVGAANLEDDGGYAARVVFEQEQLKVVASGKTPNPRAMPRPLAPAEPAASETVEQVALSQPES